MPKIVIQSEQIEAMCRLLSNSGDITPMGVRLFHTLWEESEDSPIPGQALPPDDVAY